MQMDGFLTLKGSNVELVGAPETIFVLPIGHVVSSKGEFDVDDESYKAMKAQIAKRGVDLVVDYEHQRHHPLPLQRLYPRGRYRHRALGSEQQLREEDRQC